MPAVIKISPARLINNPATGPPRVRHHGGDGGSEDHAPHPELLRGGKHIKGALHGGVHQLRLWVDGVLQRARGRHVEHPTSGAALHGLVHGGGVEEVGVVLDEAAGGAGEGEEVRRVGAWEHGEVDGGVAVFQKGLHNP